MVPIAVRVEKNWGLCLQNYLKGVTKTHKTFGGMKLVEEKLLQKNCARVFLSFIDKNCYG